jgi:para-aminobenzoate synthetase/4-amino-4-deoxychorismate lyase
MGRPFFLLRDSPPDAPARWLDFGAPVRLLEAWRPEEVLPQLLEVEAAVEAGAWAIGFLSYEAAPALDPALAAHDADPAWPLGAWAITAAPREVPPPAASPAEPLDWRPLLSAGEHAAAVGEIRAAIARGETYQANFTFPLEAAAGDDPFPLFAALDAAQRGRHAAFLDFGERAVLCASPELFFRRDGGEVVVRPMKGTARRGRFLAEEPAALAELHSEKNRAENLMIVDMMRNDLGKVAVPGSVRVTELFAGETYPTVHQLVSEVRATTAAGQVDLLRALFPCASITGAPKAATQAILKRLERGPRGVYTGAVGYFAPGRKAGFAVAIRTIAWRRRPGRPALASFGTGGGIVWDSDAAAEYRECQAKALVLTRSPPPFSLLETLLWRPRSGFFLLAGHLRRITASAAYFGFPCDPLRLEAELAAAAALFPPGRCRVRLLLAEDGGVRVEATPLPCSPRPDLLLALDSLPAVENEAFLFHKTTWRRRYEEALGRFPEAGEVALWNEAGELTETTRGNLVLRFGRDYLTPALHCGLLPGVYRAEMLERGRISEARLPLAALAEADEIFHLSALRGWWRCRLAAPEARSESPAGRDESPSVGSGMVAWAP